MSVGFTLIELVLVILLIACLSSVAIPKWLGKSSFTTQGLYDEFLSRLRLVQTINMHEHSNRCTQLIVDSNRFYHVSHEITGTVCPVPDPITVSHDNQPFRSRPASLSKDLTVTLNGINSFVIFFDKMGRPLGNCAISNDCILLLSNGRENRRIKIESEGYIHEIP
ncbi:MSHA biogenesis protein MshC [Aeromonas hydrophila]|nr:MSHA biogenesis protein MshC [Aeromonas hydrophila]